MNRPLSMAVLDPAFTRKEHLEVLVATADTSITLVSAEVGEVSPSVTVHDLQARVLPISLR